MSSKPMASDILRKGDMSVRLKPKKKAGDALTSREHVPGGRCHALLQRFDIWKAPGLKSGRYGQVNPFNLCSSVGSQHGCLGSTVGTTPSQILYPGFGTSVVRWAPLHHKEPTEVASDASWTPFFGGIPGTSNWKKPLL